MWSIPRQLDEANVLKLPSLGLHAIAIAGLLLAIAVAAAVGCGTPQGDEGGVDQVAADADQGLSADALAIIESPTAGPSEAASTPLPSPVPATPRATTLVPDPSPTPPPFGGAVSAASRGDSVYDEDVVLVRPEYSADVIEAMPDFGRRLGKDDIRPIYEPVLVSVEESEMLDGDHVLGVEVNGEAHAYPIRVLNGREMVNDMVGGVPILATW